MDEFEFIATHLSGLSGPEGLGLLDDAALWQPPDGHDAIISTDTLVEGVHFPAGKFDSEVAQKLVAVNISDLTAKGADPLGYFLNLTVSKHVSKDQLIDFCVGLNDSNHLFGVSLWGGDTS